MLGSRSGRPCAERARRGRGGALGAQIFLPQAMRRATTQLFLSKLPTVESLAQLARVYDEIELCVALSVVEGFVSLIDEMGVCLSMARPRVR